MNTMIRISTLALVVVALTGCGAGLPGDDTMTGDDVNAARTAQAVVSCYAGSCDGQDPGNAGCDVDATTVASAPVKSGGVTIGTIAIRYSPACRAAWARTSTSSPYYLRAEIYRGGISWQAASPSPVTALRSPMLGVLNSGTIFKAVGYAGRYYNDFSYSSGSVSAPIY